MDNLSSLTLFKIFIDGSCTDQSKTFHKKYLRKGGIGIYHPDSKTQISEHFPLDNPTNIRAELWAAIRALKWVLQETNIENTSTIKVILYCDCKYVINSMTSWIKNWKRNGWKKRNKKPVQNKELLEQLDLIISNYLPQTKFIKVDAHKAKPTNPSELWLWNGNNIADKLANEGRLNKIR